MIAFFFVKSELKLDEFIVGEWTFQYYGDLSVDPESTVVYNITTEDDHYYIYSINEGIQEEEFIGEVTTDVESNEIVVVMDNNEYIRTNVVPMTKTGVFRATFTVDGVLCEVVLPHPKFPQFVVNVFGEEKKTIIANRLVIVPPKSFFQKYGMFIMIGVVVRLLYTFFFLVYSLKRGTGDQPAQPTQQAEADVPPQNAAADAHPKDD
ncbi:Uncharacterized protein QTN25_001250 [Entamoeba marina]